MVPEVDVVLSRLVKILEEIVSLAMGAMEVLDEGSAELLISVSCGVKFVTLWSNIGHIGGRANNYFDGIICSGDEVYLQWRSRW